MAVASESTIRRIRTNVKDRESPFKFPDRVYMDQVEFALEKLSYDFDEDYETDQDVPKKRMFLLEKLATIKMCLIRAADEIDPASSESDDASAEDGGDITMTTVPGLQVQEAAQSPASTWIEMADRLQEEYDNEVYGKGVSPSAEANMPEVQVGHMFRTALRTGERAPYALDQGIDAPTGLTATVVGSDIVITWTPVYDVHFIAYEVYQALAPDTLDVPVQSQIVENLSDPHGKMIGGIVRPRVVLEDQDPGTYEICMASVSDTLLRSFTAVVTVTVP